jgi:enoyl-CoA hydratase/carnithine racemase
MLMELKSWLQISPEDLKNQVILKKKDDVFYLVLNTKANAFTKEFVRAIHKEIDKVEAN